MASWWAASQYKLRTGFKSQQHERLDYGSGWSCHGSCSRFHWAGEIPKHYEEGGGGNGGVCADITGIYFCTRATVAQRERIFLSSPSMPSSSKGAQIRSLFWEWNTAECRWSTHAAAWHSRVSFILIQHLTLISQRTLASHPQLKCGQNAATQISMRRVTVQFHLCSSGARDNKAFTDQHFIPPESLVKTLKSDSDTMQLLIVEIIFLFH